MKFFVSCLILFAFSFGVQASGPTGPSVLTVKGQATLSTGLESALTPAKVGQILREKAVLETGDTGMIKLRLDAHRTLILFEETRVSLPGIRWEGGGVSLVILERGRLRWVATGGDEPVSLRTAIFELSPPPGDYVFRLDPKAAQAEVQVIKGETKFQALNAESSAVVKTGEKILFQGVLEEGEIAYDILLKGRRIPRGQLGVASPMAKADLAPYLEEEKRSQDLIRQAQEKARQRKKADERAGLICFNPKARLNECAWICEGNRKGAKNCEMQKASVSCVRMRCNANGQWSDRAEMPKEKDSSLCKATPVVRACDY